MPKQPTLLALFAHPDDEAFTISGTLSELADQGIRVILICATRGEAGEISDARLASPETLGAVREEELRRAGAIMGLDELIFLDYRDSGMVNTPANDHPDAFINARSDDVVRKLVAEIRRLQPDVLVTFEPFGGYGHPDHLAIHNHTAAAFFAAAGSAYFPDLGTPWQAARLFHTGMPRSFFIRLRALLLARGEDVSDLPNPDERPPWPGDAPSIQRDISPYVERKLRTIGAHRTQINPDTMFQRLPEEMLAAIMNEEQFVLAYPPLEGDDGPEDLFSGLATYGTSGFLRRSRRESDRHWCDPRRRQSRRRTGSGARGFRKRPGPIPGETIRRPA